MAQSRTTTARRRVSRPKCPVAPAEEHEGPPAYFDEEKLREVVRESMIEALKGLGVDTTNPLEVQKDLAYLRTMRTLTQKTGVKLLMTGVWFITISAIVAVLLGLGVPAKFLSIFGYRASP